MNRYPLLVTNSWFEPAKTEILPFFFFLSDILCISASLMSSSPPKLLHQETIPVDLSHLDITANLSAETSCKRQSFGEIPFGCE